MVKCLCSFYQRNTIENDSASTWSNIKIKDSFEIFLTLTSSKDDKNLRKLQVPILAIEKASK